MAQDSKESACNAGDIRDPGSIPGLGRSPGEGNGNPLQYSCLKNPMDRGAWQAAVQRVLKSRTQLSDYAQNSSTQGKKRTWNRKKRALGRECEGMSTFIGRRLWRNQ